jgi:hypothetical protein
MKRLILTLLILAAFLQAAPPERIRAAEKKSAPLAMGMSLVLPGAGQWYAGKKVAAALYLGAEAALIGGNVHFTRRGRQGIEQYEDYADTHWSVTDWLAHYDPAADPTTHTAVVHVDNRTYSPQQQESYNALMQDIADGYREISIERDYHFYENIGKYEQFKKGWDDWTAAGEDPGDPLAGVYPKYSDNQYTYASLRRNANDLLKIGGYFGTALFFNHIISAADAGFRIKKHNAEHAAYASLYCVPYRNAVRGIGMRTGIQITF